MDNFKDLEAMIMKKSEELQKMLEGSTNVAKAKYHGSSRRGLIKVVINGHGLLEKTIVSEVLIKEIKQELDNINTSNDKEDEDNDDYNTVIIMLKKQMEDLFTSAYNDAKSKVTQVGGQDLISNLIKDLTNKLE